MRSKNNPKKFALIHGWECEIHGKKSPRNCPLNCKKKQGKSWYEDSQGGFTMYVTVEDNLKQDHE